MYATERDSPRGLRRHRGLSGFLDKVQEGMLAIVEPEGENGGATGGGGSGTSSVVYEPPTESGGTEYVFTGGGGDAGVPVEQTTLVSDPADTLPPGTEPYVISEPWGYHPFPQLPSAPPTYTPGETVVLEAEPDSGPGFGIVEAGIGGLLALLLAGAWTASREG